MSCARGQTMIRSGEQPKEGKGCWGPGGVQRSGGTWFQLLNYPQAVLSAGIGEAPTDPQTVLMLGKMGFQLKPLLAHGAC